MNNKLVNFMGAKRLMAIYILLSSLVVLIIPWEIARAFIILPNIIFIPLLIGAIITKIYLKNLEIYPHRYMKYFYNWILGTLFIVAATYIYNYFNIDNWSIFVYSVSVFSLITFFISQELKPRPKNVFFAIIVVFLSLVPLLIIKAYTPFPLQPAGDAMFFSGESMYFTQNIGSGNSIINSDYFPVITICLAFFGSLGQVEPLSLLWCLPFVIYPVFCLGIYYLSFNITKNRYIAVISAILPSWFLGYRIIDILSIRPKTLIFIMFPYIYDTARYFYYKYLENKKDQKAILIRVILFFMAGLVVGFSFIILRQQYLIYYIVPIMALMILGIIPIFGRNIYWILIGSFIGILHSLCGLFLFITLTIEGILISLYHRVAGNIRIMRYIKFGLIISIIALILFSFENHYHILLNLFSYGKIIVNDRQAYNYPIIIKVALIPVATNFLVFIFGVLGFYWFRKKYKEITALIISIFLILLIPLPFIYRVADLYVFPLCFSASCLIFFVLKRVYCNHKISLTSRRLLSIFLVVTISLAIICPFWVKASNGNAGFSASEYQALEWIKNTNSTSAIVITSPELTRVSRGILGEDYLSSVKMPYYDYSLNIKFKTEKGYGFDEGDFPVNTIINDISDQYMERILYDDILQIKFKIIDKKYSNIENNHIFVQAMDEVTIDEVTVSAGEEELALSESVDSDRQSNTMNLYFNNNREVSAEKAMSDLNYFRNLRHEILGSFDAEDAYEKNKLINDAINDNNKMEVNQQDFNSIFIVNSRVIEWATSDDMIDSDLKMLDTESSDWRGSEAFKKFLDTDYFKLLYKTSDNGTYVFTLADGL